MKKIFAISLTLAIVAMLGTGCGGKGTSTTKTTAAPTSSAALTTTKVVTTTSASATSAAAATTSVAPATTAPPTTNTTTPPATTIKTTTTTITTTSSVPITSTTAASGNDLATILGKAAGYTSYSCDVSMTGSGTTTTSKYWIKMGNPTKFKMESTVGTMTTATIFNGTLYYMYTPATKSAIMISVPPAKPSDANSTTQYNPKYIGPKTVNGYACAGYEYTDTSSGVLTTMWISTQYGVTVEIASSTGTMDYSNFNFSALPDSTFELPAGTAVMTIPGM